MIFPPGQRERQIPGPGGIELGVSGPNLVESQSVPGSCIQLPKTVQNGNGHADGLSRLHRPDTDLYLKMAEMSQINALTTAFRNRVTVNGAGDKPYIAVKMKGEKPVELMQEVIRIMQDSKV